MSPNPSLGDVLTEAQVAMVLWKTANRCRRKFAIAWTGSKIPRGVVLLGYKIVWTQHGRVIAEDATGKDTEIGIYQRVIEFGGPGKDQHSILVAVFDHLVEGSEPASQA